MKKIVCMLAGLLAVTAFGAGQAAAKEGDWIVRAGVANVDPDADSDVSNIGERLDVDVDDDTQLGITTVYMVTDHIGLELLVATPFEHDISSGFLGVDVGTAKQLPPTLNLQYYFLGTDSSFRPYAGVGINYTIFFDEDTAGEFDAIAGKSDLQLDDSWGLSLQVGLDYHINDKWLLNATVWNLDIQTTATIKTENLGTVRTDVDIDPWVYMVGVGYKF
jgi:outer membrane protein